MSWHPAFCWHGNARQESFPGIMQGAAESGIVEKTQDIVDIRERTKYIL